MSCFTKQRHKRLSCQFSWLLNKDAAFEGLWFCQRDRKDQPVKPHDNPQSVFDSRACAILVAAQLWEQFNIVRNDISVNKFLRVAWRQSNLNLVPISSRYCYWLIPAECFPRLSCASTQCPFLIIQVWTVQTRLFDQSSETQFQLGRWWTSKNDVVISYWVDFVTSTGPPVQSGHRRNVPPLVHIAVSSR